MLPVAGPQRPHRFIFPSTFKVATPIPHTWGQRESWGPHGMEIRSDLAGWEPHVGRAWVGGWPLGPVSGHSNRNTDEGKASQASSLVAPSLGRPQFAIWKGKELVASSQGHRADCGHSGAG